MGSSSESKPLRCQSTFIQPGVFSRMRRRGRLSHRGEKKKFTHKATPARCASHYKRSCCIFLGSYMLSFDTQRSHGVRDAPSHGNSPERVHEVQDRALTVKSIKQRAGIQPQWFTLGHNDQSMICAEDFFYFIFYFFLFFSRPGVYFANLFYFAREETDIANSSV